MDRKASKLMQVDRLMHSEPQALSAQHLGLLFSCHGISLWQVPGLHHWDRLIHKTMLRMLGGCKLGGHLVGPIIVSGLFHLLSSQGLHISNLVRRVTDWQWLLGVPWNIHWLH